ncbi:MAG: hypothetical protein CMJ31_09565 [Phycisphaerae bacterium]|nr:hypothetical protein [Phycisphaerae bacterium]
MTLTGIAIGCMAGSAAADVMTTSASITVDSNSPDFGTVNPVLSRFDTMGGTRVLTGIDINLQLAGSGTIVVENFSETAYSAGEWSVEGGVNWIYLAGMPDGGEETGSFIPFFGLGGFGIAPVTGDIEAGMGPFDPFGGGMPGRFEVDFDGEGDSVLAVDPSNFDVFIGTDDIVGVFGPFTDLLLDDPNFALSASTQDLLFSGTLSLTYTFDVVPAPGVAATLGFGGMIAARRRRAR